LTLDWTQVAQSEAAAARGWPALETLELGPWTLRFASGYTKRANSVQALGSPWPEEGPELLVAAEAAYRARGLVPTFKVPQHPAWAPLDEALERRGYHVVDPSRVLVVDLEGFAEPPHPDVVVEAGFTPRWLDGLVVANGVPGAQRAAARAMVLAVEAPLVASVTAGGREIAWAYTALVGDQGWVFDLVVAPEARRRGWGRAVVATLAHRAADAGSRTLRLMVLAANTGANALYESLGFVEAYRYHYRQLLPNGTPQGLP